MPEISIITPVYCDASQKVDWLDEMIESVIAQNFTDWEMILIDDKSPLPIGAVKMKYDTDERLRWFDNSENFGPSMTRNTAVALAKSDCILPLDSDDLLADSNVLDRMYDEWTHDTTKIIYGNLQQYTAIDGTGTFQRGRVIELGHYTFELAMNLMGIMPVTAMHSRNCFLSTGGWKVDFNAGLEDVEYWISAGERGYCGQKINYTTLVYRQQDNSRARRMKFQDFTFEAMQQKIKELHSDIYQGRFPDMACGCSDNATPIINDPIISSQQNSNQRIVELSGFNENELEWVLYSGGKKGRFDILAQGPANLPASYTIYGTGQIFQIHKRHRNIFAARQRLGFQMNQPDPRIKVETEPVPQSPAVESVTLPEPGPPAMSTIVRMDAIAAETIRADIQPLPAGYVETNNEPTLADIATIPDDYSQFALSDLALTDRITAQLAADSARLWTVEKLSRATPETLIAYQGIGMVSAKKIISKAQSLINSV